MDTMKGWDSDMRGQAETVAKSKLAILFIGLFMSVLAGILCLWVLNSQEHKNIQRIQTLYAERTENLMNRMFHKTDILAATVKISDGDISEDTFQTVSHIVYEKNSGIRGIQYMPGAVVTYSYPIKGNEEVIGQNFLKIPERRKDVLLAINTKSMVLSGPYHLLQGGLGVVARNPVFLKDASGKEYFWGFSAIVLNLPDALNSAGLSHIKEEGYDFQLYCENENGERIIIDGNPKLNTKKAVCGSINVPRHKWTLAISNRYPWMNAVKSLGVSAVCILLTLILWKLSRAVDREKAAVLAKDRFFSNISHDMRTPLNAVLGFVTLAEEPGASEEDKNTYIEKIGSAGELLLELVNDTLTLSKASNGKIQLKMEPCTMEEIGEAFIPTTMELAARKNIQFNVDCSCFRKRNLLVDRFNLEKIFLNLVTNAIKYTPEGGHVTLILRDEPQDSNDPDMVFIVQDDGIGMSQEFLTHVFEPFVQENRRGYESAGTGLGLAIVKQLVDLMGGTIHIESERDRGTTITVRFHFAEVTDDNKIKNKDVKLHEDWDLLAGKKILVCEDNALNQEIEVAMLKSKGMEVSVATNGQIGLTIFENSAIYEYAAILMDRRMPVMDGLTATEKIRQLNRPDATIIPIIAMTADAFSDDIQECIDAGMNAHLAKPINQETMFSTLMTYIGKDRS